jgi:uncharacterized protein (TIRG00374 family)
MLAAAAALCLAAVTLTLLRWFLLVRAIGIPIRLRDTLRLGFLGYLFNLAPMGIVGGDLLKAILLGREQHGHKTEALTSVFVDRMLGLWVLFLLASVASVFSGFYETQFRWVCEVVWGVTVAFTAAVAAPLLPDLSHGRSTVMLGRIPYIGRFIRRIAESIQVYRHRLPTLAAASLLTFVIHALFASCVFLIAAALYQPFHSLAYHLVMVPICSATGVIPISMGPFEGVLDAFYAGIPLPDGGSMKAGQGLVVALGYRIATVIVAAVGLCYYLGARREVAEAMEEENPQAKTPTTLETPDSPRPLAGEGPAARDRGALTGAPPSKRLNGLTIVP